MKTLARSAAIVGLWSLAWGSTGEAQAGKAPSVPFHYHYININSSIPDGYWYFDVYKITNNGRVYGTLYLNTCEITDCPYAMAVYSRGAMTVLHKGFAYSANQSGT